MVVAALPRRATRAAREPVLSYAAGVDKARKASKRSGRSWSHGEQVDAWRDGHRAGTLEALRWCEALGGEAAARARDEIKRRGLDTER